jgi:hypothetical protein
MRCNSGIRTKDKGGRKGQSQQKGGNDADINFLASSLRNVDLWTKYVLSFEMLELEVDCILWIRPVRLSRRLLLKLLPSEATLSRISDATLSKSLTFISLD